VGGTVIKILKNMSVLEILIILCAMVALQQGSPTSLWQMATPVLVAGSQTAREKNLIIAA
jgi:hypothetical protein